MSYRAGSRVEVFVEPEQGDCLVRCTECGILLAACSWEWESRLRDMVREIDANHREWCVERKGGPEAA